MYKFGQVLILTLLFFENRASTLQCSPRKGDNSCICKRSFNDKSSAIENEADCSRIHLQTFPDSAQLIDDLTLFDLSHNEIQKLDENENKFFSATVEILLLSYNKIDFISQNFFKDLPNLRKLDLSHNNLTDLIDEFVFASLGKLEYLDLSFNYIKTVEEKIFLPLGVVQYLDLSYNDVAIGEWLSQSLDSLVSKLGVNVKIETLKLDNLGLKDLTNSFFVNYTNLKHLSVADNYFEDIPLVPSSVLSLDLSGSEISTLEQKRMNFYSLKSLKLERMKKLETIRSYAFYNMPYLEELSIRNCHNLKEFNERVFGDLDKNTHGALKRLSLAGNGLQKLNSTFRFLFRGLDFVDLTDNPWRCDCDLLWLQEFGNLHRSEFIKCSSPARVNTKSLIDIGEKDLPSCYPQKYGKKSHRILISLLAVAVIILSALVAYLIYYTPNRFPMRTRRLGPQSPYNAARTGEE